MSNPPQFEMFATPYSFMQSGAAIISALGANDHRSTHSFLLNSSPDLTETHKQYCLQNQRGSAKPLKTH